MSADGSSHTGTFSDANFMNIMYDSLINKEVQWMLRDIELTGVGLLSVDSCDIEAAQ